MTQRDEKTNPFVFVKSINYDKENYPDEILRKEYAPYLTNMALSYFPDTLYDAQAMNINHHVLPEAQFSYYLNKVRKRKRFSKWAKPVKHDDVNVIMEYYNVSYKRALEYLNILTDEQIKTIKNNKGGVWVY